MLFINPVELLELKNSDVDALDSNSIKKAKRRIQAEIDLADDGLLTYHNITLHKSDIDEAINKLDNHEYVEYFHFIANTPPLNSFLINGNQSIFDSFRQEGIYKLPSFINLISPYFAHRYDIALVDAFKKSDLISLRKILSLQPLINSNDKEKAYHSLFQDLKYKIKEFDNVCLEIKSEIGRYDEDNIEELPGWTKSLINPNLVNALPAEFQSIRNSVATSIRNLSVNVFNVLDNSNVSLKLISYACLIQLDGVTKQNLESDFQQIKKIDDERTEWVTIEPVLKKFADLFVELKAKITCVNQKSLSAERILNWVNASFDTRELNSLGVAFIEIRNQLALGLRALSIALWNSYNDAYSANSVILKASAITVDDEVKQNITKARTEISEIKSKVDLAYGIGTPSRITAPPQRTAPIKPVQQSESSDSSGVYLLIIAIVVIIIIALANCNKNKDTYSTSYPSSSDNSNSSSYTTPAPESPSQYVSSAPEAVETPSPEPTPVESAYKGNSLNNGASPLNDCFGSGRSEGNAYITFKNSNSTDAIVCLVDVASNKTVRNEYIQAGSNFTMKHIPSGTYSLKVLYGNDWNPTLDNFCGTKGSFESDVHFSKSDNLDDLIRVENADDHYTTGEITLYTVANGNMQQEGMSESDFFK